MKIKCNLCAYKWDYKGIAFFYATCPRCLRKVKINLLKRGERDGKNNNK